MSHPNNQTQVPAVTYQRIFESYDIKKRHMRDYCRQLTKGDYVQPISYSTAITHGSAKWLTIQEIVDFGLSYQGKGRKACPYLGYLAPIGYFDTSTYIYARSPSTAPYSTNDELPDGNGHLLTVAPTRAGKGSGQILTNLLSWSGSVIVLDIKGENYNNSAGFRAKIGQNVYAFALSGEGGDVFNPIMSIRANLNWAESSVEERCNEEEDASYIENLLFTPSDGNEDSFWDGSAKSFIKGVLLHVRTAELLTNADDRNDPDKQHRVRERSMREVRRLICLEPDSFASLLEDMGESQRPLISEAGNHLKKLVSDDGKIGLSIWATAKEQTKAWSFERVHQATYKPSGNPDGEPAPNDFTFEQLRDGNTSIYLIVPPEHLSMYRAVLRLIVGCALRELKDSHNKAKLDPEGDDKPPVLFLLDEFPQLAYMQPIEEAMAYMAGYGVRLWLFVQDIGQLKRHYKDAWQTFMANTEAKCFFGVNDIETATWLSETLGTTTVDDVTHTSGSSNTYPEFGNITYTNSSSVTTAHVARRLMTPDEIMRMPYHEQIILIKGLKPIFCDRPGYHECSLLNQSSKIPPLKLIDF